MLNEWSRRKASQPIKTSWVNYLMVKENHRTQRNTPVEIADFKRTAPVLLLNQPFNLAKKTSVDKRELIYLGKLVLWKFCLNGFLTLSVLKYKPGHTSWTKTTLQPSISSGIPSLSVLFWTTDVLQDLVSVPSGHLKMHINLLFSILTTLTA